MKKLKLILIAVALIFTGNTVNAQMKIGYISVDNMVELMPETRKLDSILQKYQVDSLNPQLNYLIQEYNRKDSMVNTRDSAKLTAQVKTQIRQEMANMEYQVQNWQSFVQQAMQAKQQDLLIPIYRKVVDAVNAVAKESGYTHVMNKESLLVAPTPDDILPLVAKKLNVKLPPNITAGTK
jgi:outer membrane protein